MRIRVNTSVSDFTLLTHTVVGGFDMSLSSREDAKKTHHSDAILYSSNATSQSRGEAIALCGPCNCLMYGVRAAYRDNIHSNTGHHKVDTTSMNSFTAEHVLWQ